MQTLQLYIKDQLGIEKRVDLFQDEQVTITDSIVNVKDISKLIQRYSEHLSHGALIALADLDNEDGSFYPKDTEGVFHSGFERNPLQIILEKHGFREIKFITAHTINKESKKYPIFLVTATKN